MLARGAKWRQVELRIKSSSTLNHLLNFSLARSPVTRWFRALLCGSSQSLWQFCPKEQISWPVSPLYGFSLFQGQSWAFRKQGASVPPGPNIAGPGRHGIWHKLYTIGFWVMNFTPKNIVIYVSFQIKNNAIPKKIMSFTLILPKFNSIYTLKHLFYTHTQLMHL